MKPASALVMLSFALVACGEDPPPPRFPVTFTAAADGDPLEGVQIFINQRLLGETNAEGVLRRDLTGPEGAQVQVAAECPEGHRSPLQPTTITLRHVVSLDPATQARGIVRPFACPPERRHAVVVVRTDGHEGLPVRVDGREMARTDRSGVAHVHLAVAPQTSFDVVLDTEVREHLRPVRPSTTCTVPDEDYVCVFAPNLTVEEPPRRRRRVRRPSQPARPTLPVNIGRH